MTLNHTTELSENNVAVGNTLKQHLVQAEALYVSRSLFFSYNLNFNKRICVKIIN